MRVIVDTHAFLWWINDDPQLSPSVRDIMGSAENALYLSAASGWEIAIKYQLGKLELPSEPESFVIEEILNNRFRSLPIELRHALHTYSLPLLHRDPFDRVLIAQSQLENMPILTIDRAIRQYGVEVIW